MDFKYRQLWFYVKYECYKNSEFSTLCNRNMIFLWERFHEIFTFKNSTVQKRDNSYQWKIHHVIHFQFITQFSRIPKSKFVNLIFMAFFAFWQIYFDEVARLENKIFGKFICVLFFLLWFYVKPILSDFRWKTAILTIYLGFGFWFVGNFTLENVNNFQKSKIQNGKKGILIFLDSSW